MNRKAQLLSVIIITVGIVLTVVTAYTLYRQAGWGNALACLPSGAAFFGTLWLFFTGLYDDTEA